jgi:hypothetical protein
MTTIDVSHEGQCFPIINGLIGTAGLVDHDWSTKIDISSYQAPIDDLSDFQTLKHHAGVCRGYIAAAGSVAESSEAPTARLTLLIPKNNKYHSDNPDSSISKLRAFLELSDEEVPIIVIRIKLPNGRYDYWLQRGVHSIFK